MSAAKLQEPDMALSDKWFGMTTFERCMATAGGALLLALVLDLLLNWSTK